MWVEVMGTYRYGYRLGIGNPHQTRTREVGMVGFMGIDIDLQVFILNIEINADPTIVQYLWRCCVDP